MSKVLRISRPKKTLRSSENNKGLFRMKIHHILQIVTLTVLLYHDTNGEQGDILRESEERNPNDLAAAEPDRERVPRDCEEIQDLSTTRLVSGLYNIQPLGFKKPFEVYCDFDIESGGWTVIQRRVDGSVDFDRNWEDYKHGFGNLLGDFWLGNDKISALTQQRYSQLRIELTGYDIYPLYARYTVFRVNDESRYYKLYVTGYSGTAGYDSFGLHNSYYFTTKDADHDGWSLNCAEDNKGNGRGGWWYRSDCEYSNLNAHYTLNNGLYWYKHGGGYNTLKFAEMKIRSTD